METNLITNFVADNIEICAAVLLMSSLILGFVLQWMRHRLQLSRADIDRLGSENRTLQQRSDDLEKHTSRLQLEHVALETKTEQQAKQLQEHEVKNHQLSMIKDRHIELQAKFDEKERQLAAKEKMLEESKNVLLKEFELAAGKLFDAKQRSFTENSRQGLENVFHPFKQQLQAFHKHVDTIYSNENAQRHQLIGQIGELQKQAVKISDDANNLAKALKGDNKVQGDWGEVILERILEQSGLEKGREYQTQLNLKSEAGKNYRPDVVIHLPEKKDIIIDSKVALVEYERFSNQSNVQEKNQHLKAHVDVIRNHIKMLANKNYENLEGIRSIDFVFMFVPIEAAYISAIQHSPALFSEAQERNIMLVSPSSLMVALRTVETMWRYEKQNVNAEKIAASAGKLYDQFVLVMTSLEDVGGFLNKASDSYETVFNRLSLGRGNVLKRIEELKKLGAKASKALPKETQKRVARVDPEIELLTDNDS